MIETNSPLIKNEALTLLYTVIKTAKMHIHNLLAHITSIPNNR